MLLRHVAFVDLIFYGNEIFPQYYGDIFTVRRTALLRDHPWLKHAHRSRIPIFWIDDSRGF